jgi:acetyltransferase-like isoleucine patch superfamily enzyme
MRSCCKSLANGLAMLLVLPAVLLYALGCAVLGSERAFPGWSQLFGLIPGLTGVLLRRAFYRMVLRRCGPDVTVSFGTIFSHPTIEVGRGVYIGAYCCLGDITLEDDVLLGSHVSIPNGGGQHGTARLDVPLRDQPGEWPRVIIGRDTWLGDRVIVLANVGRQCIVGAGSVVTKPLPERVVAVGVPARVIRYRSEDAGDSAIEPQVIPLRG